MSAEEASELWMSANDALRCVSRHMPPAAASRAICTRAYAGLVRARAKRYTKFTLEIDDFEVPKHFWWAKGEAALEQNWITGDFGTWINRKVPLRAYGVEFLRKDILAMTDFGDAGLAKEQPGNEMPNATPEPATTPTAAVNKAGRRPDNRWEDVLMEIAAQLYVGELKPTKQADLQRAMLDYAASIGFLPSEESAKLRARKIFKSIEKKG